MKQEHIFYAHDGKRWWNSLEMTKNEVEEARRAGILEHSHNCWCVIVTGKPPF